MWPEASKWLASLAGGAAVFVSSGTLLAQPADEVAKPTQAPGGEAEVARDASESTDPPPRACIPGRQVSCACPAGQPGAQRCLTDGSGFGECLGCRQPPVTPRPAPVPIPAVPPEPLEKPKRWTPAKPTVFGFYTAFGAALDNAAFAGSVAGRYRATDRWLLGVDVEYNPWFSLDAKRFRPGTINVYATFVKRYPIDDRLSLRITGHLGVSVLLFDLIGAPAGSTGPYFGGNLLGIDYRLSDYVYLVLDPADFSVPIPHVTGAPLIYRQYRITVGFQFGA